MHIKIPVVRESSASMPVRGSRESAGFDLCANLENPLTLKPGSRSLISTGLKLSIPHGFCGLICSRTSLALVHGITVLNAPGIIDSDYRGDVGVVLANLGEHPFTIEPGLRVAKIVFMHYMRTLFIPAAGLAETDRDPA